MDKEKLFPTLSGTRIDESLKPSEIEGLWDSVHREIHHRRRSPWPRLMFVAAAAVVVLALGLWGVQTRYAPPQPEMTLASTYPAGEALPMIQSWDGDASMIYETESHGMKVAFVVDKSLKWE
jgi:negative regulator of sigma E activity